LFGSRRQQPTGWWRSGPPMRDVLVVDDDFMVAEIHRRFVERVEGFRAVGVARSGAEALTLARELRPHLILLDVYLPDMTGLEVLQRLRSEGDRVGVIMITAARELDTVSGALDGGAADYLIKPFEFPQLRAKLEAFAARADALESAGGVDQSLIDSLFGGQAASAAKDVLPKGLGAETGRLVLAAVQDAGEMSAAECAEKVGISRVSARRYLEHYLSTGALDIRLKYGRAGRPERRYRTGR
jgi:response regulator of citrate/malate metabolism